MPMKYPFSNIPLNTKLSRKMAAAIALKPKQWNTKRNLLCAWAETHDVLPFPLAKKLLQNRKKTNYYLSVCDC